MPFRFTFIWTNVPVSRRNWSWCDVTSVWITMWEEQMVWQKYAETHTSVLDNVLVMFQILRDFDHWSQAKIKGKESFSLLAIALVRNLPTVFCNCQGSVGPKSRATFWKGDCNLISCTDCRRAAGAAHQEGSTEVWLIRSAGQVARGSGPESWSRTGAATVTLYY